MEFFRIKHDIPFMRHALVFNVISAITFLLAVIFLFVNGLHFSIEFTGGTVMEVNYPDAQVQNFGTSRDVMIRLRVDPKISGSMQSGTVFAALTAAPAAGESAQ